MPVFALYNFDDAGTTALDSAPGNGAQNGIYLNGATAAGGQAVLDGHNDIVKIYADPAFQLDRGTLELQFTTGDGPVCGAQTVLSRDSTGETEGGYHIDVLPDGSILIVHETDGGSESFGTPAGFVSPGEEVHLTYSWDQGGSGGQLVIENLTSGETFDAPVPASLTMDQGAINQPWIIGAGQADSDPAALNDIDQHFEGTVGMFSISDSVDNLDCGRDGIVYGTGGDDLIDIAYAGDNDGDVIDGADAILPGAAPNDDLVVAGGGNDTVFAGQGSDLVYGGDGDDLIDSSGGAVALPDRGYPGLYPADADPANDLDTVHGGAGDDTITTGDDNDLVFGEAGDDLINGGFDDDSLFGGSGDDTIIGGEGADLIEGGDGDDLIYGGLGPSFPDAVNIPDATDLRPDNGRDTILGGAGDDTIYG
ncbi:MAG TPA: calcium-binding protein, partial [Paracoccaceae bacterium]